VNLKYTAEVVETSYSYEVHAQAQFASNVPVAEIWDWVDAAAARLSAATPTYTYEGRVTEIFQPAPRDVPRP
jgi:hypothetical protein